MLLRSTGVYVVKYYCGDRVDRLFRPTAAAGRPPTNLTDFPTEPQIPTRESQACSTLSTDTLRVQDGRGVAAAAV